MRILITGSGGAAAISVWKSLKNEHELYMADMDPAAAGLYLVAAEKRLMIPRGTDPQFAATLLKISVAHQIELIISTVDAELAPLAKALDQFVAREIKIPLCSYQTLKNCYDKYTLLKNSAAHRQTMHIVPEFILLNKENFSSIVQFPCFAKPRIGAGSTGAKMIQHAKELTNLPMDNSYLIQEFLPGDEYSVDIYIDSKGHAIAAVPRLRMKIDSGIAVTARTQQFPALAKIAITLAELMEIRYVANIQFKASREGQFKLLEINPRFSGTLPLTAAAGVDIPKLLLQDIQGKTLPQGLLPFQDVMVVRYWTEHFFPPAEWEALCQQ